jgi:hypothetical protein
MGSKSLERRLKCLGLAELSVSLLYDVGQVLRLFTGLPSRTLLRSITIQEIPVSPDRLSLPSEQLLHTFTVQSRI